MIVQCVLLSNDEAFCCFVYFKSHKSLFVSYMASLYTDRFVLSPHLALKSYDDDKNRTYDLAEKQKVKNRFKYDRVLEIKKSLISQR